MDKTEYIIILIIFNLIFIAFLSAIIIFIRQYWVKKKAHKKELETVDLEHKKELLSAQLEIQMQTMKHIGRELHDNVGQKLTLSSLYLQQLSYENENSSIVNNLTKINTVINESLHEIRHLSKSLTDDTIENFSISELLEKECNAVQDLKECKISFQSDYKIIISSYRTKSVLLRITQEFLQNSIKHSHCKNIEVSLKEINGKVKLSLQDDGKGFDVENIETKGIGLKNIQKRIEIIKGVFHLESKKNLGTKLTIEIPIE